MLNLHEHQAPTEVESNAPAHQHTRLATHASMHLLTKVGDDAPPQAVQYVFHVCLAVHILRQPSRPTEENDGSLIMTLWIDANETHMFLCRSCVCCWRCAVKRMHPSHVCSCCCRPHHVLRGRRVALSLHASNNLLRVCCCVFPRACECACDSGKLPPYGFGEVFGIRQLVWSMHLSVNTTREKRFHFYQNVLGIYVCVACVSNAAMPQEIDVQVLQRYGIAQLV